MGKLSFVLRPQNYRSTLSLIARFQDRVNGGSLADALFRLSGDPSLRLKTAPLREETVDVCNDDSAFGRLLARPFLSSQDSRSYRDNHHGKGALDALSPQPCPVRGESRCRRKRRSESNSMQAGPVRASSAASTAGHQVLDFLVLRFRSGRRRCSCCRWARYAPRSSL